MVSELRQLRSSTWKTMRLDALRRAPRPSLFARAKTRPPPSPLAPVTTITIAITIAITITKPTRITTSAAHCCYHSLPVAAGTLPFRNPHFIVESRSTS